MNGENPKPMRGLTVLVTVIVAAAVGFLLGVVCIDEVTPYERPTPQIIYVTPQPTPQPLSTRSLFDEIYATPMPSPRPTVTPTLRLTPRPTPIPTLRPTATSKPTPTATLHIMGVANRIMEEAQAPTSTDRGVASVIIGESANIRSGPSTDYKVLEKVLGGARVYCLENGRKYGSNGWYKVRTSSGTVGYVSPKLVAYNTTAAPTQRPSSSQSSGSSQRSSGSQRTVYVSRTGHAYHCDPNCWGMINPWVMTEAEARSMGRTKCSYCW